MDAYGYLAFFLILFVFFIYIVWFGYSVKLENQKEQGDKVSINPYDQIPLRRRLIDKKNSKVGIFDLDQIFLLCCFSYQLVFYVKEFDHKDLSRLYLPVLSDFLI